MATTAQLFDFMRGLMICVEQIGLALACASPEAREQMLVNLDQSIEAEPNVWQRTPQELVRDMIRIAPGAPPPASDEPPKLRLLRGGLEP